MSVCGWYSPYVNTEDGSRVEGLRVKDGMNGQASDIQKLLVLELLRVRKMGLIS